MTTMLRNERNSSVELLRLILMALVMVSHADFRALGAPVHENVINSPIESFLAFFIEALSVIAVNSFVFLSGWYGIKPSFKKFFSLYMQILTLVVFVYIIGCFFLNYRIISAKVLLCSMFLKDYWFLQSYIILFFFAPVLNSFLNGGTKIELLSVLFSLVSLQVIWGWLPFASNASWIDYGYSPFSFFLIYLLAGFIRRHIHYEILSSNVYFVVYLAVSLLLSILSFIGRLWSISIDWGGYYYSSPFVLLSSVCFCLCFLQLKMKSAYINTLAKSSLAIYVVHCHPCIWHKFLNMIRFWKENDVIWLFLIKSISLILVLFVFALFLDRIRLLLISFFYKYKTI